MLVKKYERYKDGPGTTSIKADMSKMPKHNRS